MSRDLRPQRSTVTGFAGALAPEGLDSRSWMDAVGAALSSSTYPLQHAGAADWLLASVGCQIGRAPRPDDRGHVEVVLWGRPREDGAVGASRDVDADQVAAELARSGEMVANRVLSRLDGSFAIVAIDTHSRALLLSTDRFASRPVYWTPLPRGGIAFATRLAAIGRVSGVDRSLDHVAVKELLHYQRLLGTRTLFSSVAWLTPGTAVHLGATGVRLQRWHDFDYEPETGRHATDWADELSSAFRNATQAALRGGRAPGLLMSGGLDARLVLAASGGTSLRCLHVNHLRNREYRTAQRLAHAARAPLDYVHRRNDHYLDLFDEAVRISDGQHSFVHAHALGALRGLDVDPVLHAWAPELLFRGTNLPHRSLEVFGRTLYERPLVDMEPGRVAPLMYDHLKYTITNRDQWRLFRNETQQSFRAQMLRSAEAMAAEARDHSDTPADWFTWPDVRYHSRYPSFLFESSLREHHREESVVFANEVWDLHRRMPVTKRADNRIWLQALAMLAPELARVPDANTGMRPSVPRLVTRPIDWVRRRQVRSEASTTQHPLGITTKSWPQFSHMVRHHTGIAALVGDTIEDDAAIDPDLFDKARLRTVHEEHRSGQRNHHRTLLLLTTFGRWHARFGA